MERTAVRNSSLTGREERSDGGVRVCVRDDTRTRSLSSQRVRNSFNIIDYLEFISLTCHENLPSGDHPTQDPTRL